jgi:hypothetical protein
MKKFIIALFSFTLLTLSTTLFAQQEAHIFIPTLKTDKLSYSQGETIRAEFEIDNNSTLRQSDVYITTSLVTKINDENVELDIQKHFQDLYLEAESKRTLSLEHVVNADINGPAEFVLNAYLKDGSLVGQKRNPVTIKNTSAKDIILFDQAYVSVDDITFPLQAGPTVPKESTVQIEFTIATIPKENILVQPKIELYDRTQFSGKPIQTITPSQITLSSNGSYSFSLPTDLDPKVYEGVLSFSSNDPVTIPPTYFRYIIEGPIGTILNANANKLTVSKGETVSIFVEYAGIPPVVENLENFSFENTEASPEEFEIIIPEDIDIDALPPEEIDVLIKKLEEQQLNTTQTNTQKAIIKVSLVNEKGEVIGAGTSDIDLNNSGKVALDIQISEKAKQFSIVSEMVLEDGTVLSAYKTNLPSEKELKDAYSNESKIPSWIVALFSLIALLIVLIGGIFVKKKLYKHAIVLIIPLLATIGSYAHLQTSNAFTVEFESIANASEYFKVNAIFSPGPSDSVSYAPGEAFNINLNASYVACGNNSFTNSLYGPSNDWSNFDLSQMTPAFDYQRLISYTSGRSRVYYIKQVNIINEIGDGSFGTLNRFNDWWTSTTDLPWVETAVPKPVHPAILLKYPNYVNPQLTGPYGFYLKDSQPIQGKGGFKLWESSAWGSGLRGVTKHEASSSYNINPNKTYYMPTKPGFHTFYFMLQNRAGGNTASTRIVSQTVCVRGAGKCLNEVVEPPLCPLLTGTITQNAQGQILQNGVLTNYILNTDGTCSENACHPSQQPINYGEACGCTSGEQGTIGCSGACVNSSGNTIATICSDDVICRSSSNNAVVDQTTITYTADVKEGVNVSSYQWYIGQSLSNKELILDATQSTYTKQYTSLDEDKSRIIEIIKTDGQSSYSVCPLVNINCGDKPTSGETVCTEGIQNVYLCTDDGWALSEIPCDTDSVETTFKKFEFNPNVAGANGMCTLTLEVENVVSCALIKRSDITNPIMIYPTSGTTINVSNQYSVGTYTLGCQPLDLELDPIIFPGSQSCYSNADIREN